MTTYSVPYSFTPGTKAAAEEVNANFSYLAGVLDSVSTSRKPFCINEGPRDTNGSEKLISYTAQTLNVSAASPIIATQGNGISFTVNQELSTVVAPTAYASIIPMMTSSSQPDVTATATSEAVGAEAWHAFDKNEDVFWGSFVGVSSASLTVQIMKSQIPSAYKIKTLTAASWTLEASNDGTIWTVLDEYEASDAAIVTRKFDFLGNYNTFRLTVTASSSGFQTRISELDIFKKDANGSFFLEEVQNVYLTPDKLVSYANTCFVQSAAPTGKRLYSALIPEMKSNLVPDGYQISASSFTAQGAPYLATDRSLSTCWEAADSSGESWLQVQFPNSVNAKACKITLGNSYEAVDKGIKHGYLLGSNNGSTWITLYHIHDFSWSKPNESKYLFFPENSTKFTYYRIVGTDPFASLAEFQLFAYADNGEYYLGEADVNDVWFKSVPPYSAQIYIGSDAWSDFSGVLAGRVHLDSKGKISSVYSNQYNQNGLDIDSHTTKEYSGNIVTYDSFITRFGETGYMILPNDSIIQWGKAIGGVRKLFPAAFPNAVYGVFPTPISDLGAVGANISELDQSGFLIKNGVSVGSDFTTADVENYWIAIGR